jgi:hypothetical protein
MMPDLIHALANERAREQNRSLAAHMAHPNAPTPRPHRVPVKMGYWLISIGCRLVAPDLRAAAH